MGRESSAPSPRGTRLTTWSRAPSNAARRSIVVAPLPNCSQTPARGSAAAPTEPVMTDADAWSREWSRAWSRVWSRAWSRGDAERGKGTCHWIVAAARLRRRSHTAVTASAVAMRRRAPHVGVGSSRGVTPNPPTGAPLTLSSACMCSRERMSPTSSLTRVTCEGSCEGSAGARVTS